MKIMIIDDHAGVRNFIRQLVAAPGDTVWECDSGSEAVPVARHFQPDYVTVDVRMPGLNGFETTRAIRAEHPTARVVIVSAFDQPELRQSAAEAGAIGYVVKENLAGLGSVLRDGGSLVARHETAAEYARARSERRIGSP